MAKILNLIVYETDKQGNQLISKFTQKPQCRVMATFEGDNIQRTGFIDNVELAKSWKVGDDINVVFYEKESNGVVYKNFKLPGKNDALLVEIDKLKKELKVTQEFIKKLISLNNLKTSPDAPQSSTISDNSKVGQSYQPGFPIKF